MRWIRLAFKRFTFLLFFLKIHMRKAIAGKSMDQLYLGSRIEKVAIIY
jgi:hypothetical protein